MLCSVHIEMCTGRQTPPHHVKRCHNGSSGLSIAMQMPLWMHICCQWPCVAPDPAGDSVRQKLFPCADSTCCVRALLSKMPLSKQVRLCFSNKVIFIPIKMCLHSTSFPNNTWLFVPLPLYQTGLIWRIQICSVPFPLPVWKSEHVGAHLYTSSFNCIILFG